MPPDSSPYPLSRSHLSTTRLIAQHTLWQLDLRFLIHPTIIDSFSSSESFRNSLDTIASPANPQPSIVPPTNPYSQSLSYRIADLATGTAIWPLSLLHQYPNARITASDISLSQIPFREWLPPGLEVREWDIYTSIPNHWVEYFDVVHIRLALLAVKSNDTHTVLRNAWEMLRPGGWMQWDELDPEGAITVFPKGTSVEGEDVRRFHRMQELTDFARLKWVRGLEQAFEDVGFESVQRAEFQGQMSTVGFFQSLQFLVMEEEVERKEEEAKERVGKDVEWGVQMSEKGFARVVPKVVIWGQKPLEDVR